MPRFEQPNQGLEARIMQLFPTVAPEFQYSFNELSELLNLRSREDKIDLSFALQKLLKSKQLKELSDGRFTLKGEEVALRGRVDFVNPRFAYIRVEGQEGADIYIPAEDLKGAQHGDLVELEIFENRKKGKQDGRVINVIDRARTHYVGTIYVKGGTGWLTSDYRKMHDEVMVHGENLKGAKNGQKVMVEIRSWGTTHKKPVGIVTEVLGTPGENNTEMHAILADFNIPLRFTEEVEAEANAIPAEISNADLENRRDFRSTPTCTIDPFDAKDFDDALSIKKLQEDVWEVGIHIADVSHFMHPGSELDKSAFERATSIYLVDRVSPMLPERLSNGLCSLVPNEDRLTFACVVQINSDGKLVSKPWIGRTIIHSDRRFTYEEVQEILEGKPGDFAEELQILNKMAISMRNGRLAKGAMSFESTEVKFVLDPNGVPLKVVPKIRKDAHKLIEEFMLLANKSVAEYAYSYKDGKEQNPMVYRIHESPNPERLETFADFAARFGYKINTGEDKVAASLNAMVSGLEGKPEQELMQNLAIRVMAKARYTTKAIGHFGLAFQHYSHFTSPIRRYPDVLTHRLLWNYLMGESRMDKDQLEKLCVHCSEKEKNAADAERASIKYKQVEFMALQDPKRIWAGVISGVTEWGVYVDLVENRCEGMIRIADIHVDSFDFLEEEYCIVGRKTGLRLTFGDKVNVRLKGTDMEKRTIDFYLEDAIWNSKTASAKFNDKKMKREQPRKGGKRRR